MCSSEGVRCTVTAGKVQPSHLSLNCGDDVEVSVAISAEHTAQGPELHLLVTCSRHMSDTDGATEQLSYPVSCLLFLTPSTHRVLTLLLN